MDGSDQGPVTVAQMKKKIKRESFMGEDCHHCRRLFKITKDYKVYKLTCPYCGKKVESTRIMQELLNNKG